MTLNQKIKFLFKSYGHLWLLYILFFIAFGVLSIWFPELKNNEYEQTGITEMLRNNPFQFFVLACIFAPIVEEMMFRTLIKPSHPDIILFLCSWPVFIGLRFLPKDIYWAIKLIFGAILLFTLFHILKQLIPPSATKRLQNVLHRFTIPALIIISVLFGLVHINNYVDTFVVNAALLILIIPRIISGFMMGWVKIKTEGLPWAMGLHFLNNAFVVLIGIAAQ